MRGRKRDGGEGGGKRRGGGEGGGGAEGGASQRPGVTLVMDRDSWKLLWQPQLRIDGGCDASSPR